MYISSDTNIWFDFETIGFTEHPFLLDNEYYLSDVTYHDEIRFSETIRKRVISKQLHITPVSPQELQQASELSEIYPEMSIHDAIALSIAKTRKWTLLSGDGNLRKAAEKECVECHGTLWIYSLLRKEHKVTDDIYQEALKRLLDAAETKGRRLPKAEIIRMINEAKD